MASARSTTTSSTLASSLSPLTRCPAPTRARTESGRSRLASSRSRSARARGVGDSPNSMRGSPPPIDTRIRSAATSATQRATTPGTSGPAPTCRRQAAPARGRSPSPRQGDPRTGHAVPARASRGSLSGLTMASSANARGSRSRSHASPNAVQNMRRAASKRGAGTPLRSSTSSSDMTPPVVRQAAPRTPELAPRRHDDPADTCPTRPRPLARTAERPPPAACR